MEYTLGNFDQIMNLHLKTTPATNDAVPGVASLSNRTAFSCTLPGFRRNRPDSDLIRARMMRYFVRCCAALIILAACFSAGSMASSLQAIPSYTLRYEVIFQGNKLGELEMSVRQHNETVIVRGETFPNALAQMLGEGKIVETVEYIQHGDTLQLVRLTEQKGVEKAATKTLIFDRDNHTLWTDNQPTRLNIVDQIDAYTFPLLSILGLSDVNAGNQIQLVRAGKIRSYRDLKPIHETIHNRAGSFDTLKQSKTRLNNSNTIALWVTQETPLMPVQIQAERNDGHQVLVSLISISE